MTMMMRMGHTVCFDYQSQSNRSYWIDVMMILWIEIKYFTIQMIKT